MKKNEYSELICRKFCKYYKPGREDMQCGGYVFLRENLTPAELEYLGRSVKSRPGGRIPPSDSKMTESICLKCDFMVDGCDFIDNRSGPPCGGYILVKLLFTQTDSL